MNIPGLIDKNIAEIDEQYRTAEGLASVDDIRKLMKIYNIGKTPLSPGTWIWRSNDTAVSGGSGTF